MSTSKPRPWIPTYFKDLMYPELWFPGCTAGYNALGSIVWPHVFRVEGMTLVMEDMRCWGDLHKSTCECRLWEAGLGNWEPWIKR